MEVVYLADYPSFVDEVAVQLYQEWGHLYSQLGRDLEEMKAVVRNRAVRDKIPLTLLALNDGELVGQVSIKIEEPYVIEGLSPWIGGLLVKANWRGRGIGKALLSEAERVAAKLEVEVMYLTCEADAESFYEWMGWRVRERTVSLGDEVAVMYKNVA